MTADGLAVGLMCIHITEGRDYATMSAALEVEIDAIATETGQDFDTAWASVHALAAAQLAAAPPPPPVDLSNAWVDAEDAADLVGLTHASLVRSLARDENWAIKGESGEVMFYLVDVQRTASARRVPAAHGTAAASQRAAARAGA